MESSRFCGVFCSAPCSWATVCRPCKNPLQSRALKVAIPGIESEARTITVGQVIAEVDFQSLCEVVGALQNTRRGVMPFSWCDVKVA
jgi:hypothetical protein